ncbi:MAG: undecaprenyl-diphosphate phosphatase [Bacilli bacterium]|nr:undecaprenyl-diphosphate phosphatase [Bacilli bacterium]MBN2696051.1 undecaprenyl-diphosphate phosphatase [Bacilli bacterium]
MNVLEALKYLFLGIVQGITEVLPISSSGHVEFFKEVVGLEIDEGLLFLILVNTGSLITFVFVYRHKLAQLIKDFFLFVFVPEARNESKSGFYYVLKLGVASIPAGIVGIIFSSHIDRIMIEYNVLLSGVGLVFTGTILLILAITKLRKGNTLVSWMDAIFMGLAQAVALVPGVSRSGMTTSTALKRGHSIDSALDFSFLMYIPVSLGSLLMIIVDIAQEGISVPSSAYYIYYAIAGAGAIIATYFAFLVVFNAFKTGKLKYFGYYCLLAGVASIIIFIMKN